MILWRPLWLNFLFLLPTTASAAIFLLFFEDRNIHRVETRMTLREGWPGRRAARKMMYPKCRLFLYSTILSKKIYLKDSKGPETELKKSQFGGSRVLACLTYFIKTWIVTSPTAPIAEQDQPCSPHLCDNKWCVDLCKALLWRISHSASRPGDARQEECKVQGH